MDIALAGLILSGFIHTKEFNKMEPKFKLRFARIEKIVKKLENSDYYFNYLSYDKQDVRNAYEYMLEIIRQAQSDLPNDEEAGWWKDLHELLFTLQFLIDPERADAKLPPLRYKDDKADAIALFFNSFFTNDTKIVFRKFEEVKDEYQD